MTGYLNHAAAIERSKRDRRIASGTFTCFHCQKQHPKVPKVGTIMCPCGKGGHVRACPALITPEQRTSIAAFNGAEALADYLADRI